MSLVRPSEPLLVVPGESGLRRAVRRIKRTFRDLVTRPQAEAEAKPSTQTLSSVRRTTILVACLSVAVVLLFTAVALQNALSEQEKSTLNAAWRDLSEPAVLVEQSRALMNGRDGVSTVLSKQEWPAAVADALPFKVSVNATCVKIALNIENGSVPEHGYLIVKEGQDAGTIAGRRFELVREATPGLYRYTAR